MSPAQRAAYNDATHQGYAMAEILMLLAAGMDSVDDKLGASAATSCFRFLADMMLRTARQLDAANTDPKNDRGPANE